MSELIQMGKEYVTRDGRAVRVLCVDGEHFTHPVVALITHLEGYAVPATFTANGRSFAASETAGDLIPRPVKHTRTVWLNVYIRYGDVVVGQIRETRASADSTASDDRIACIERTIEFFEGEGL